jgi:hypothetical protein
MDLLYAHKRTVPNDRLSDIGAMGWFGGQFRRSRMNAGFFRDIRSFHPAVATLGRRDPKSAKGAGDVFRRMNACSSRTVAREHSVSAH